ncbi:hypothetical protein BJV82DRAFT_660202 [Fennellomyces sp. T-0311]|nr:hypothetical protein BJV82DRAFT_660202 [Fennellomyces sp. T-0311]
MTVKQHLLFDYKEHPSFINLLEKQAEVYKDNVVLRYQLANEPEFKSMTYGQLHCLASSLAKQWAPLLQAGIDTVGLLAESSIHYLIATLAILKLDVTLTVLSPTNTIPANVDLLTKTGCGLLFATEKYSKIAEACAAQVPEQCEIKVMEPLNFDDLDTFKGGYTRHKTTTSLDSEKTVIILHTSGTTSLPKPIRLSNRYMIILGQIPPGGLKDNGLSFGSSDVILPLVPLHHIFGVSSYFMPMLYGASSLMFGQLPPSSRDIAVGIKAFNVSLLCCTPFMLNQMAQYIETTQESDILRKTKACIVGGASLSKPVGDFLCSKGLRIGNGYGSTETMGVVMSDITDHPKRWYIGKINDFVKPYCEWEPVDEDSGIYHLVVKANCPCLATGVGNRENGDYATNDLFVRDKAKPGYWLYVGRRDNMLAMENGKKTNPIPMENIISDAKIVRRCSVIGEGRQCTAALVELEMDQAIQYCPEEMISQVQEAVELANKAVPTHSRIFPSLVYILPLNKQLPTTSKGTVIRKQVIKQYENQIEKMYYNFLHGPTTTTEELSQLSVDAFLAQAACQILQQTEIDPETSLFDYGLNSLLAIQLRNRIAARFENIPSNFLFEHPTLASMAEGLTSRLPDKDEQHEERYQNTQVILESYLERASIDFPVVTHTSTKRDQHTVLLTGATGSLGAFMLRDMILSHRVKKIYCLVRGGNLMQRVKKSFKDRLLDTSLLESKVEVLPFNLNAPYLGWDEATYVKLKNEVTIVQHCAWLVDFNQPVQHFERECIRGMYNLLKFAYREIDPMHVHIVSSISATAASEYPIVPEEVSPQDPHVAMPMGYAQSKYIAEHLFSYLTTEKNFPCIVERLGQVCGDTKHGAWKTSEQYPLLMIGGTQMGLMPDLKGIAIDWLPVDFAATSIVDIMLGEKLDQSFYHIVNPQRVTWSDVLEAMQMCGMKFEVVQPEEWVQALSKHQDNPAYRLLSFFETHFRSSGETKMPLWQTQGTVEAAPCLAASPPFSSALLQKYLAFWQDVGFYQP